MAVWRTATLVANYISTVENNGESENDERMMEDDGDDSDEVNDAQGEAGSEDDATNENKQGDKHNERFDTQSGHEALPDLLPKKGTKFKAWRHFGLRHEDGKLINIDKPVCKFCLSIVSAKDGNTTNLYAHLRNKHPDEYAATKIKTSQPRKRSNHRDPGQPTIQDSFLHGCKLPTNCKEHKQLTKSITYWLAKDGQPEYSVEKPGFKQMVKTFCPRYQLPSRNYFSPITIPKLFCETYQQIQNTLASSEVSYFSATTDLWTSCAKDPFLSFTLHHISPQWELLSNCLCTRCFADDHTGENLKDSLLEIFAEWSQGSP